ncbi:hypothetical protein BC834DRAFT_854101 [Gloeopeniophorella convolvens]|nr:hypothetical protein BC834DRAFT_854101 [Gloeopeniophorella convolvens]
MSPVDPCTICCPSCASGAVSGPEADAGDPFAVENLLPAGTLSLSVARLGSGTICDHAHVAEGWHAFSGEDLLPYLVDRDNETLCRHLDFLVEHEFISVQSRVADSGKTLTIRVYIIPHDLPGVQGRLRIRDEASILKPAKLCLRNVLTQVVKNQSLWDGHDLSPASSTPVYFMNFDTDNRTLAEIYGDLPSPNVPVITRKPGDAKMYSIIHEINLLGQQIPGLRSRLHPYQRESVAAMIFKEMSTSDTPDPLYLPVTGLDGNVFFLQPATMEILREQPMVAAHHGGVLCEELGTGKTIMILALVLATIDQLPKPEESIHDARPVMTPLAFRHFPHPEFEAARKRLTRRRQRRQPASNVDSVPRLLELMLHYVRTSPDGLHLRQNVDWLQNRGLLSQIDLNAPFYFQNEDPVAFPRSRRNKVDPGVRKMYLTTATLIVVPANLLAQWNSELMKHCLGSEESDDAPRPLLVKPKDELPTARLLSSNYDIVLMNHDTFSREVSKFDRENAFTWNVCQCPVKEGSRIPDCMCDSMKISPLFQIRWKRLVVDEGHIHGTDRTNISKVASLLSAERRWLVTGTPTTNLLGLNLGGSEFDSERDLTWPEELSEGDDILPAWDDGDADSLAPTSGVQAARAEANPPRIWTKYDREDLRRLGTMMITFLQIPRFATETRLFSSHVVRALFGPNGPQPGAIAVLIRVMNSIMVRHRIQDIEVDVSLPPLTQETVLLDLDPVATKSYNALQAVIVVNAVDSERKDQDYLFHPNNAAYLQQLVSNMSQLMFWHVDEKQYNVDELAKTTDTMVEKAQQRGVSDEDIDALKQAKRHILQAAGDMLWRAIQVSPAPEVPFVLAGIPEPVLAAWSELPYDKAPAPTKPPLINSRLLFPQRLAKLRELVIARPFTDQGTLIEAGHVQAEEDKLRHALLLESVRKKSKGTKLPDIENVRETLKAEGAARQSNVKVLEMQNELRIASENRAHQDTSDSQEDQAEPPGPSKSKSPPWQMPLSTSSVAHARLVTSKSSKLNYLLKEVLTYSLKEKFLIFSGMPLTLAHVADALALAGVMFLQYTTASPVHVRQQYVTTFETSDKYRVFLMELKHGSRGLNLISASRVIFCEPVWQADVEAQAVKRVHRIGQTKPITVKTLAIRNSAEEMMLARRAQLKSQEQKLSAMTDDFTMRNFIANPRFMEETQYEPVALNIPLFGKAHEKSTSDAAESVATVVVEVENSARTPSTSREPGHPATREPPIKKKRTIRFAD